MSGANLNPRQDGLPLNWARTGLFIVRENTTPQGPPREAYCLKGVTSNSNPQGDPLTQDLCYFVDDGSEVNLSGTPGAGNFSIVSPVAIPGGAVVPNDGSAVDLNLTSLQGGNFPRFVRTVTFRKEGPDTVIASINFEGVPLSLNVVDMVNPGTLILGSGDNTNFLDLASVTITAPAGARVYVTYEA